MKEAGGGVNCDLGDYDGAGMVFVAQEEGAVLVGDDGRSEKPYQSQACAGDGEFFNSLASSRTTYYTLIVGRDASTISDGNGIRDARIAVGALSNQYDIGRWRGHNGFDTNGDVVGASGLTLRALSDGDTTVGGCDEGGGSSDGDRGTTGGGSSVTKGNCRVSEASGFSSDCNGRIGEASTVDVGGGKVSYGDGFSPLGVGGSSDGDRIGHECLSALTDGDTSGTSTDVWVAALGDCGKIADSDAAIFVGDIATETDSHTAADIANASDTY